MTDPRLVEALDRLDYLHELAATTCQDEADGELVDAAASVVRDALLSRETATGGGSMSTKFTPGPWKVADDGSAFVYKLNSDGINQMAVTVHGGWRDGGDPSPYSDRVSNAHLIAAAPDLYEALDDILSFGDDVPSWAIKDAYAALAKARGVEP